MICQTCQKYTDSVALCRVDEVDRCADCTRAHLIAKFDQLKKKIEIQLTRERAFANENFEAGRFDLAAETRARIEDMEQCRAAMLDPRDIKFG